MTNEPRPIEDVPRVGGHPVLDFTNTVHHRYRDQAPDYLCSYAMLVRWGRETELLTPARTAELLQWCETNRQAADDILQTALALREDLYELFAALIEQRPPNPAKLKHFNQMQQKAGGYRRLAADTSGQLEWIRQAAGPDEILWPLAYQAGELLTSAERSRIKRCPHPEGCGWLYLDRSKNRSRRWCSMRDCGNSAKVKRHYRKNKKSAGPKPPKATPGIETKPE